MCNQNQNMPTNSRFSIDRIKRIIGIVAVVAVVLMLGLALYEGIHQYTIRREEKQEAAQLEKKNSQNTLSWKEQYPDLPDVSASDWDLILVNDRNPIETRDIQLTQLKNGYSVEQRVFMPYYELADAAAKDQIYLTVVGAYRTIADQETIYSKFRKSKVEEGLSTDYAIAKPGETDHNTGLGLDVIDESWYLSGEDLVTAFGDTDAGKWLQNNSYKYGFIVRFPKGKEEITHVNYEPWHLRYVGKESAEYIHSHAITLEEYVEILKKVGKN